jgi:hypothetical protein
MKVGGIFEATVQQAQLPMVASMKKGRLSDAPRR